MKEKIKWTGPSGYNPLVGNVTPGQEYEVDEAIATRLKSEKVAKAVKASVNQTEETPESEIRKSREQ